MTIKIDKKIIGQKVKTETFIEPRKMSELIDRPIKLTGNTYKIKPSILDNAMYITINDIELDGTTHPYEIFINSKSMEHFQWVISLTRVISAIFRKGGDITFLIEELISIQDPKGGYYKKGGVFMPSLVAEIGSVIKDHMKGLGLIEDTLTEAQRALIEEKKAKAMEPEEESEYPSNATMCNICFTKAVVILDKCKTCLACGDSECN